MSSPIDNIENFFDKQQCLEFDRSKCSLKHLRLHLTDVRLELRLRRSDNSDAFLLIFLIDRLSRLSNSDMSDIYLVYETMTAYKKQYQKILQDDNTIISTVIDLIYNYHKTQKNFRKIKYLEIEVYFKKYLEKTIVLSNFELYFHNLTFDTIYNRLLKLIKNPTDKNDDLKLLIELNFVYLRTFLVSLMDIYTLTRIFRDFRKIAYQNSLSPKYNIIMAGNEHINNYIKIFTDLGFETIANLQSRSGCFVDVKSELNQIKQVFITV